MVRSVLKLSPNDFMTIKNKLPTKSKTQKEVKKFFYLDETERKMLNELKDLLEIFEWVTDELQSNDVSISRVYPCVNYLRKCLTKDCTFEYTKEMRKDLLCSLHC